MSGPRLEVNGSGQRPEIVTQPSTGSVNDHFAAVGAAATPGQYEHGIQVIDEDKQFKYGCSSLRESHRK